MEFLETLCDALKFHTCFSHKKRLGQLWNLLFFHQKGVNPDIEGIICTWFGGTESRFYFVEATKKRIHLHHMFLEHWNRQKSLSNIRQHFSCLLDKWIEKKCKFIFFRDGFFLKSTLSVLRCTWTGRIIWKYFWDIILTI